MKALGIRRGSLEEAAPGVLEGGASVSERWV